MTYTKVSLGSGGSAIRSLQTGAFDLLELVNREDGTNESGGMAISWQEDVANQVQVAFGTNLATQTMV